MAETSIFVGSIIYQFVSMMPDNTPKFHSLPGDPLLTVSDLTISFKQGKRESVEAVRGISFKINAGQTVALVGESGSGKSVTALSLSKLLPRPPDCFVRGHIAMSGQVGNLLTLPDKLLTGIRGKRIAYIFQEPSSALNPVYSIGYQVAEAIRQHLPIKGKVRIKERAIEILDAAGIPNPRQRYADYPHQMSGGMLQRVMIAMAVVCEPDLLIADEPTTALDVTIQKQIMNLLGELRDKYGMAIILITHNFGIVSGFADKVLVMRQGLIVEENSTCDIFKNPQHAYTRGLLACIPKMGHRRERLITLGEFES